MKNYTFIAFYVLLSQFMDEINDKNPYTLNFAEFARLYFELNE